MLHDVPLSPQNRCLMIFMMSSIQGSHVAFFTKQSTRYGLRLLGDTQMGRQLCFTVRACEPVKPVNESRQARELSGEVSPKSSMMDSERTEASANSSPGCGVPDS